MLRCCFWSCVALLMTGAGCSFAQADADAAPARPNIILLYTDDVGWGDLSCYNAPGAAVVHTPNLDALAHGGVRFTSGYATSATCTPSRFSLMTGTYAFRTPGTGILAGNAPLIIKPGSDTLPSQMQEAGYATAMIGKWHLGIGDDWEQDWNGEVKPGPLEVGFDESYIIVATPDRVPCVYLDGHRVDGWSPDDDPIRVSYKQRVGNLPTGKSNPEMLRYGADGQHSGTIINRISRIGFMDGGQSAWWTDETMADILLDRAGRFMTDSVGADQPFFMFLSLHDVHVPRAPAEEFIGQSDAGLYGDTLLELDAAVGKLMARLDALGVRDNTLIIFSADNGPIMYDGYYDQIIPNLNGHDPNGPFKGGKYLPFEGGTRLPLITYWPGGIAEPKVSDAIVSQVDLMHSLSALVGAPAPKQGYGDSANVLPALLGRSDSGRGFVVQQSPSALSIRWEDWKFISAGKRGWTPNKHKDPANPTYIDEFGAGAYLFNLAEDPGETTNLIKTHPQRAEQLRRLLERVKEQPMAGRLR